VRDEAARDQQNMEICLREIERLQQTGTQPDFIALLGGVATGIGHGSAEIGVAPRRLGIQIKPLSCTPPVIMQNTPQGPNQTENPDHPVKTD
jgi:hypothetical protein